MRKGMLATGFLSAMAFVLVGCESGRRKQHEHLFHGFPHWKMSGTATVGLPFEGKLVVTYCCAETRSRCTWSSSGTSISTGKLPPGLRLDAKSGTISGVPEVAGDYSCTIRTSGLRCTCGWLEKTRMEGHPPGENLEVVRIVVTGD
ncbi:MAG: putative Ig domain-containing protein [Planctomycetes bacterium]|nr:putative Ig domain-containing protein [Planctomycetota bacterium]